MAKLLPKWGWWRKHSTAAWRGIIEIRVRGLEDEQKRVDRAKHNQPDYQIATAALASAREAAKPPTTLLQRVLFWWSGARVEEAWAAVREAEDSLVVVQGDGAVKVQITDARALVAEQFSPSDPRRLEYEKLLAKIEDAARGRAKNPTTPLYTDIERAELSGIRKEAHKTSDNRMRDIRRSRNWLLLASFGLTLALLVVAIAHVANPRLISVCATPAATSSSLTTGGPNSSGSSNDLCPDGSVKPHAADVFEVELVGAIGGMLAGLLVLTRLGRAPGPYSLPTAQVLLKAPAGAATALIGVLLLEGGALAGLSRQPGSAILAYAALFGFAQQILTGLVDRQANELTSATDHQAPARSSSSRASWGLAPPLETLRAPESPSRAARAEPFTLLGLGMSRFGAKATR